jgi:hypothetical protein
VEGEKSTMETGASFLFKNKAFPVFSTEKNLKNSYITKESTVLSEFMIKGTLCQTSSRKGLKKICKKLYPSIINCNLLLP